MLLYSSKNQMQGFSKETSRIQKSTSSSTARQSSHLRDRLTRPKRHELQRQEEHIEEIRLQSVLYHT